MEEICEYFIKFIILIDLVGYYKYLKIIIFGLIGYCLDFVMFVVFVNIGMGKRLLLYSFFVILSIILGLKYMYCKWWFKGFYNSISLVWL